MHVWDSHAFAAVICICCIEKSAQQCQLNRVPANCPTKVRLMHTYSGYSRKSLQVSFMTNENNEYSVAGAPTSSTYDRPNRLKGREDGAIRWVELLEKFRSVQERARRSQRHSVEIEDTFSVGVGEFRIGEASPEGKNRDSARAGPSGPPVPTKDQAPVISPPPVKKSGLGRQFGRLGGAVSGKSRRNQ